MKKSWIKSLLVVIMAVLLVVTLVACNPKPEPGNNEPEDFTTGDYFDKLWELTSNIGGETIGETDDLALHFGIELDVTTRRDRGIQTPFQQLDLGFDVQAILGRKPSTSKNTSLKVRLYDPTDTQNNEIVTLYLFANDLDNLYMDFAGKNLKVSHNVAKTVWNDILGKDGDLGDQISADGMGINYPFGNGEDSFTINEVLNDFLGDFGPEWTLNTLINKVVDMLGLGDTIRELLQKNWSVISMALQGLQIDDIIGEDGTIDLLSILTNKSVQPLFKSSKTAANGVNTYKAKIEDSIIGILSNALPNAAISDMFGSQSSGASSELSLIFTEKNNEIDSFSIFAKLGGMITNIGKINNANVTVIPEIKLTITDLSIERCDSTKDGFTIDKNKYTEDIAVREQLSFEIDGATLNSVDGFTNEAINLDTKIELTLLGHVDIVNLTNNQTQLNLLIDMTKGDGEKERIATASFANGVLAGKLEGSLADGITLDGKLYKGFTANIDFNPAQSIRDFLTKIFKKDDVKTQAVTAAEDEEWFEEDGAGFTMANWLKAIKSLLKVVRTDNNLVISTTDVLGTIVDVVNNFGTGTVYVKPEDATKYNAITTEYFHWTREGREARILSILTNPPMADKSFTECLDFILGKNSDVAPATDDAESDQKQPTKVDAALRMLYLIAEQIKIDGIEVPESSTRYEENIKAVLGAEVTIIGDVQSGVHLTIEAKIGGATIKITESLDVIEIVKDGENATFTNVVVEGSEEDGYYNLSEFFNGFFGNNDGNGEE